MACVILVLVGFIAYAVTQASQTVPRGASIGGAGTLAPAFHADSLSGVGTVSEPLRPSKPEIINFFASWCPNCRSELGAFGSTWHRDKRSVSFIGVDSLDPNPSLAKAILKAAGASYRVALDPRGTIAARYGVRSFPATIFIDTKGRVVRIAFGAVNSAFLTKWIRLTTTE